MKIDNLHLNLPFSAMKGIAHFFGFDSNSHLEDAKQYVEAHSGKAGLRSDWKAIGNDFKKSIQLFNKQEMLDIKE